MIGRFGSRRWLEPTLDGASEQSSHQALIRWLGRSPQSIFARFDPLHIKLLACFDAILFPDTGRKDNLALAGDTRLHECKISSYIQKSSSNAARVVGAHVTSSVTGAPKYARNGLPERSCASRSAGTPRKCKKVAIRFAGLIGWSSRGYAYYVCTRKGVQTKRFNFFKPQFTGRRNTQVRVFVFSIPD